MKNYLHIVLFPGNVPAHVITGMYILCVYLYPTCMGCMCMLEYYAVSACWCLNMDFVVIFPSVDLFHAVCEQNMLIRGVKFVFSY